ncbi:MAG: zinc-dependent alcohol dehydrogenase [Opitutales bacterium]
MLAVKHVAPRKAEVIEMEDPEVTPGHVVVRMKAGGICGSDLHIYRREPWQFSKVLGHEPCGVVESVGEGVTHLNAGDRVTVYHYESCGHCQPCRQGYKFWCDVPEAKKAPGWHITGSCAEKVLIKAENALKLPDDLTFDDGALIACGAGTAYSALRKLHPNAEDSVTIIGLGPIGLCLVRMFKAHGCRVFAVGRRQARLDLAEAFGADTLIDIDREDDPSGVVKQTLPGGTNLAVETSGKPEGQRQMLASLSRGARCATIGIGTREPAVNLGRITGSEITIYGSYVLNFGLYEDLCRFMINSELKLDRVVTHRIPYSEGTEAFALADQGDAAKVVLTSE